MGEQTGQQLIDAFFSALGLMQLEQCQELLQALGELSKQAPAYQSWHTYLNGILANELHRDWATGEHTFRSLLETDLEPALHGRVLLALGRTYDYQGRWREALDIYEQCLHAFDRPDQAIDRAKIWKNMAITLEKGFTQGEFGDEALRQGVQHCQLALEALNGSENPSEGKRWLEATTWNTLGLVYRSLADWPQATHCFERRIALGHDLDDRYGIGAASHNLGEVLQRQGPAKQSEALQAYVKALTIYREFGDRYNEIDLLADLGTLHRDMGESELALECHRQAIQVIEDLRAGVSAEAARAGFFATVVDTYANTVLLCLEGGRETHAFNYVERARSRAFLDVLTTHSPQLSQRVSTTPMTLSEVQAALPTDGLLIEYFTTGLVEARDGRTACQRHRFPPGRTLIFAVTRSAVEVHDAGLSPTDLLPRQLDSAVERHFLEPQIRRALYKRLVAPVEGLLQGRRRLYLVPHGPLHYIPFQALIAPDGDTLLRKSGPQLIYAPSATILLRHGRAKPGQAPEPCLALGYNGEDAKRLRFAEQEARGVARLTGGQVLAGPSLKKAALYRQATSYQALHFSCHGEFDPQAPLASALHLAPGEDLTALDVLEHLRLRCDLVTLSACESGLSRVRRGDELVGLIRAFMHAGAPALVSTLWRVDERSTLILMERFYQEVRAGLDFAEALKKAQLYLKNLTRREAMEVLERFPADEGPTPTACAGRTRSEPTTPVMTSPQTSAYLKGSATEGGENRARTSSSTSDETDDDLVFADPYYWAPFVLVGGHRLVVSEEE